MRAALLVLLLAIATCASAARAPPPGPTVCQALDCLSCVKLPNCGWCISQQTCLINTTLNCDDCFIPAEPNAPIYCPAKLCSLYPDCGSCTTDPNCGWCGDNNKCVESDGCPGCLPGGATCRLWKAGGDQNSNCSITTLCSSHTDCESCNTDPSCGWCGASLTCEVAIDGMVCNSDCDGCVVQQASDGCPANHTKCADYTDCYNCVSEPSCGWCPTNLRCSESTDFGFCNGDCEACFVSSGSPNACPAPGKQCTDFTSCAACAEQPGCGWCPETAKCVPGTEFDQCSGSCPSCWQFGDDAACPEVGTTCSDYTDCASCTEQNGCGWCPVTGVCVYGTDYDQCSGSCEACWQYGEDAECPAPHTTCLNYTDCASCTAQNGCGWCALTNECVSGTDFDQCTGSCSECWQYGDDAECPAAHTKCADYKDCASCSAQGGCGWCGETGVCTAGTEDGPCSGSCEQCWQCGESAECPAAGTACGNYTDCASCTEQNGCGWCPVSETCVPSNMDGQCSGSCSACFTTEADNCPSSGSCPQFNSQATCSAQSGCMWCTNSNTCVWGDGYEPCLNIQCTTN